MSIFMKNGYFYWKNYQKTRKKVVFFLMEKHSKLMKKWLKLTKNWTKIEKNELLYGENIKFHSKNGCFLLKNYRKTRKKVVLWKNAQNS